MMVQSSRSKEVISGIFLLLILVVSVPAFFNSIYAADVAEPPKNVSGDFDVSASSSSVEDCSGWDSYCRNSGVAFEVGNTSYLNNFTYRCRSTGSDSPDLYLVNDSSLNNGSDVVLVNSSLPGGACTGDNTVNNLSVELSPGIWYLGYQYTEGASSSISDLVFDSSGSLPTVFDSGSSVDDVVSINDVVGGESIDTLSFDNLSIRLDPNSWSGNVVLDVVVGGVTQDSDSVFVSGDGYSIYTFELDESITYDQSDNNITFRLTTDIGQSMDLDVFDTTYSGAQVVTVESLPPHIHSMSVVYTPETTVNDSVAYEYSNSTPTVVNDQFTSLQGVTLNGSDGGVVNHLGVDGYYNIPQIGLTTSVPEQDTSVPAWVEVLFYLLTGVFLVLLGYQVVKE